MLCHLGLALLASRALSLLGPQFPPALRRQGKWTRHALHSAICSLSGRSLPRRPPCQPAFDLLAVPASRLPLSLQALPWAPPPPPTGIRRAEGALPGEPAWRWGELAERVGLSGVSQCPLGRGWQLVGTGGQRGADGVQGGLGFPEARGFEGWFWWFLIREGRGGQNPWETGRWAGGRSRAEGFHRQPAPRPLPEALAQV